MNYFVTGGTGFIGRFLIPKLLDRGATVYLLVRKNSLPKVDGLRELWGADDDQVIAVEGDLSLPKLGVKPAWIKASCRSPSRSLTIEYFSESELIVWLCPFRSGVDTPLEGRSCRW